MALGVTKSEMGAMALLAAVIAGGLVAREWRDGAPARVAASGASRGSGPDASFASPPGKWETIAEMELPSKEGAPEIKAAPELVARSREAIARGEGAAAASPGSAASAAAAPASSSTAIPARAAAPASAAPAPAVASAAADNPAVLDLNAATPAELERLPGIGPARAAAILAERAKLGGFASVDQLRAVRGIGEKSLEKLRPHLKLGAARPLTANPAAAPAPAPAVQGSSRTMEPASLSAASTSAAAPPTPAVSTPAPAIAAAPRPVNINTAPAEELEIIPGVGPVLAGRIVERRARGRFRRPEDLLGVKGIGPKSLQKMRPWIEL